MTSVGKIKGFDFVAFVDYTFCFVSERFIYPKSKSKDLQDIKNL